MSDIVRSFLDDPETVNEALAAATGGGVDQAEASLACSKVLASLRNRRDRETESPQAEQRENRISMWRDLMLHPDDDPLGPSMLTLLDSFEKDVEARGIASVTGERREVELRDDGHQSKLTIGDVDLLVSSTTLTRDARLRLVVDLLEAPHVVVDESGRVAGWEDEARTVPVRPCPECEQGKHQNCTGVAYDGDHAVRCPCSHGVTS